MITAVNFDASGGANNGKIVITITSQVGDVPVGANYGCYIGIIDPTGTIVANINSFAGALNANSTVTFMYAIPFSGNNYIPGDYSITLTTRNGAAVYLTKTLTYTYGADVLVSGAGLTTNSLTATVKVSSSCENEWICFDDLTDHAGWTVTARSYTLTEPISAANATPPSVTEVGKKQVCIDTLVQGKYTWSATISRTKTTAFAAPFATNVTTTDTFVLVGTYTYNCDKLCEAATCLDAFYKSLDIEACAAGNWSEISDEKKTEGLRRVMAATIMLLADKCSNQDLVDEYYSKLPVSSGTDCGCGCS